MLKGKKPADMTKAEIRRMRMAKIVPPKVERLSAAHEGVVERPMDKGLSKTLAIKRAQKSGRGTSVYRIKTKEEEEEELEARRGSSAFRLNESRGEEEDETTSVAKLRPDRLQLTNFNPRNIPKSKKPKYGDLG